MSPSPTPRVQGLDRQSSGLSSQPVHPPRAGGADTTNRPQVSAGQSPVRAAGARLRVVAAAQHGTRAGPVHRLGTPHRPGSATHLGVAPTRPSTSPRGTSSRSVVPAHRHRLPPCRHPQARPCRKRRGVPAQPGDRHVVAIPPAVPTPAAPALPAAGPGTTAPTRGQRRPHSRPTPIGRPGHGRGDPAARRPPDRPVQPPRGRLIVPVMPPRRSPADHPAVACASVTSRARSHPRPGSAAASPARRPESPDRSVTAPRTPPRIRASTPAVDAARPWSW